MALHILEDCAEFSALVPVTCPLYNAHWQEEMLQAQLKGELCPHHQEEPRRLCSMLETSAPTR